MDSQSRVLALQEIEGKTILRGVRGGEKPSRWGHATSGRFFPLGGIRNHFITFVLAVQRCGLSSQLAVLVKHVHQTTLLICDDEGVAFVVARADDKIGYLLNLTGGFRFPKVGFRFELRKVDV